MKFTWSLLLILLFPIFLALVILKNGDTFYVLLWWASILLIGLIFLPLTSKIFSRFFDKGYLFSKTLGLAILTFSMWILSSFHIVPFIAISVYALVIVAFVITYIVFKGYKSFTEIFKDSTAQKAFVLEEALFLLCLVFFAFVKAHNPASGIEAPMDFAFLNNMLNTKFMPPIDIWFSGTPTNYYYYGQYMFAFLTKLCNISSAITYNLSYISLFAFAFSLTFSLTANMVYLIGKQKMRNIILAGLISACVLSLGGNLHTLIYNGILPTAKAAGIYHGEVGTVDKAYYYADPRSFIGTNPTVGDRIITEFPAYSLILGDLHAQIIDIIFVLSLLALLLAFLFASINRPSGKDQKKKWYHIPFEYFFIILLLPIMFMTNAWDFPIYVTVTIAILLYSHLKRNDFKAESLLYTLVDGVKIVLLAVILILPFMMNFFDPTEGVRFTNLGHLLSPLYLFKMFVVWGYQIFFVILFVICIFHTEPKYGVVTIGRAKTKSKAFKNAPLIKKSVKKEVAIRTDVKKETIFKRIVKSLSELSTSDGFALILSICAVGLILVSELIFQKDASGVQDARSNTVWKVTLQAFVMFDIVIGYITVRIFSAKRSESKKITLGAVIAFIFISVMSFSLFGLTQPYWDLQAKQYRNLDFNYDYKTKFPDDYNAIVWLQQKEAGKQPVILEANGDSYSDYERFSIHTGFPTVFGWYSHEWYWRGSKNGNEGFRTERVNDISTVYTSADLAASQAVLDKYNIKYIVVGKLERDKFPNLNEAKLLNLGSVVYESGTTKLIEVRKFLP